MNYTTTRNSFDALLVDLKKVKPKKKPFIFN